MNLFDTIIISVFMYPVFRQFENVLKAIKEKSKDDLKGSLLFFGITLVLVSVIFWVMFGR